MGLTGGSLIWDDDCIGWRIFKDALGLRIGLTFELWTPFCKMLLCLRFPLAGWFHFVGGSNCFELPGPNQLTTCSLGLWTLTSPIIFKKIYLNFWKLIDPNPIDQVNVFSPRETTDHVVNWTMTSESTSKKFQFSQINRTISFKMISFKKKMNSTGHVAVSSMWTLTSNPSKLN